MFWRAVCFLLPAASEYELSASVRLEQRSTLVESPMHLPEERDMRKLIFALLLAGSPLLFAACEQSVQEASQDVRDAQQNAVDAVAEEHREVQDAAKNATDNVITEQRELEDTARAEEEKILKEKRDLEDAKRREAERTETP
jgi:hypothetical protein